MFLHNDYSWDWSINFQDEATPMMVGMSDLHDSVMFFFIVVVTLVGYILMINLSQMVLPLFSINKDLNKSPMLEFIWTTFPAIILVLMAMPSFKLLYSTENELTPLITVKMIGSQWYWTYEMNDHFKMSFDSYVSSDSLFNNLEVDSMLVLPVLTPISLLMSATDVMHSWAVPSLGIKLDSMPGSLNYNNLFILSEGLFQGQCSELCGIGHSYMPMVVKAVDLSEYKDWLISNLNISYLNLFKMLLNK